MANRLAQSLSPYLQDHAGNPVDWWPWCDEAFAEARRRDVPILLSVGYAACHWCHVMAHESFEDAAVARLVNDGFVAIKVDREERPDVDALYMRATQMMSGHGGWPMTVFLDPAGRPFQAGTYYPPVEGRGMPSFTQVLRTISDVWGTDRARIQAIAGRMAEVLAAGEQTGASGPSAGAAGLAVPTGDAGHREVADAAMRDLRSTFDRFDGGFGGAPKFPPGMVCEFLLRAHARTGDPAALEMASGTLVAMARRGLYDQVGGGFARYSTDAQWVVPHFEKMLYDNALLARAYLHWWRATGDPLAERITRETLDFLITELGTGEGGFASALDADSDPVLPGQQREGAFVVWTPGQVRAALSGAGLTHADADRVCRWLSITAAGTFEHGTSVPQLRTDPDDPQLWHHARAALQAARAARPRPARDDKVVAAWNGLAIAALAEAGLLLAESRYLAAAGAAAGLLRDVHRTDAGWLRVSRDGRAGSARAVLEDIGGMAEGFLALHQATGELEWLRLSGELLDQARTRFAHPDGGFWDTDADGEVLLARLRDPSDGATPSGWTLVAGALLTHAALTGSAGSRDAAEAAVARLLAHPAAEHPRFLGWGLAVLEAMIAGPVEVAVVGDGAPADALHRTALAGTSPGLVVARGPVGSTEPALLRERPLLDGAPAAYVCRAFTCRAPTSDPAELAQQVGTRAARA
jgi:uncharacterized protein YyaL (SSP411 family)